MKRRTSATIISLLGIVMVAATVFAFTAEQASQGKDLYAQYCAVCHGPDARGGLVPQQFGQAGGKKVPPIAGPGALSGMQNALQVYEYSKSRMPLGHPGILEDEQYLAIVAFALQANGIQPDGRPLTAETAGEIELSGIQN
jgi:S-disulfanyl-L-cysteine oxidoreductase SoxD